MAVAHLGMLLLSWKIPFPFTRINQNPIIAFCDKTYLPKVMTDAIFPAIFAILKIPKTFLTIP